MKKLLKLAIISCLVLFPIRSANPQVLDCVELIAKGIKWGVKAADMLKTAQQANEIKQLMEQIACSKYYFDKYKVNCEIRSCIGNTRLSLLDVEISSAYRELYGLAKVIANSNSGEDGSTKMGVLLQNLRALVEKLTKFNKEAEGLFVEQQQIKSERNFSASVFGRSF